MMGSTEGARLVMIGSTDGARLVPGSTEGALLLYGSAEPALETGSTEVDRGPLEAALGLDDARMCAVAPIPLEAGL